MKKSSPIVAILMLIILFMQILIFSDLHNLRMELEAQKEINRKESVLPKILDIKTNTVFCLLERGEYYHYRESCNALLAYEPIKDPITGEFTPITEMPVREAIYRGFKRCQDCDPVYLLYKKLY